MDLSKAERRALWESAEQWLRRWEGKLEEDDCACCDYATSRATVLERACDWCPIYRYTGYRHCVGTPYTAWFNARNATEEKLAAEREYVFLVSLALGENP